MTGSKGNSEFCFPEAKPRGTLKFPEGPAIKCFVIPPDSKLEKNCEKLIYSDCACSTS